jgi:hypothetical protein
MIKYAYFLRILLNPSILNAIYCSQMLCTIGNGHTSDKDILVGIISVHKEAVHAFKFGQTCCPRGFQELAVQSARRDPLTSQLDSLCKGIRDFGWRKRRDFGAK